MANVIYQITTMLLFSTAIHPPQHAMEEVRSLRQEIKNIAGEFKRENTIPHVTINVFTPGFLKAWERQIQQHLVGAKPFEVFFSLQFFVNPKEQNSNLVFAPTGEGKQQLIALMRSVNSKSPKSLKKITSPHITVAYGLGKDQCDKLKEYFANRPIHLTFTCDRLVIRKREDDQFAQYQVYKEYIFGATVEGLLF